MGPVPASLIFQNTDTREAGETMAGGCRFRHCAFFLGSQHAGYSDLEAREAGQHPEWPMSSPRIFSLTGRPPTSAEPRSLSQWKVPSILVKRPKSKTILISHHLSMYFSLQVSSPPHSFSWTLIWLQSYQSKKIFCLWSETINVFYVNFLDLEDIFFLMISVIFLWHCPIARYREYLEAAR